MKTKPTIIFITLAAFSLTVSGAPKKKTVDAATILKQGREAFLNYDFEEAADLYDQYKSLKKKAKQDLDEEFEIWEQQLDVATNAFDRVQKIEIIDSISLPLSSFYNAYKMASSAGRIGKIENFNLNRNLDTDEIAFLNEDKDYLIVSVPDETGVLRLQENRRLLDGSWETYESLQGDFDKSGDYIYPFMSGDGQTLYFASDGNDSMGGYDIFVAQKDPFSNEYRQPLNVGMPFNSPYNDFMMAIDEENGLGWWATDRNSEEGNVTVYVYLLDETRKNYSPDDENLTEYAKISDYRATQNPDKESVYIALKTKIGR